MITLCSRFSFVNPAIIAFCLATVVPSRHLVIAFQSIGSDSLNGFIHLPSPGCFRHLSSFRHATTLIPSTEVATTATIEETSVLVPTQLLSMPKEVDEEHQVMSASITTATDQQRPLTATLKETNQVEGKSSLVSMPAHLAISDKDGQTYSYHHEDANYYYYYYDQEDDPGADDAIDNLAAEKKKTNARKAEKQRLPQSAFIQNLLKFVKSKESDTTLLKDNLDSLPVPTKTSNTELSINHLAQESRYELEQNTKQDVIIIEEYETTIQSLNEELRQKKQDLDAEKVNLKIASDKLYAALEKQTSLQESLIKSQKEYNQRVMDLEARYKLEQPMTTPQALDMEKLQVDIKKKLRSAIRAAEIEKELAIADYKSKLSSSKDDVDKANRRIAEIDEAIAELRAEKNNWRKLAQDSAAVVKTRVNEAVQKVFRR